MQNKYYFPNFIEEGIKAQRCCYHVTTYQLGQYFVTDDLVSKSQNQDLALGELIP